MNWKCRVCGNMEFEHDLLRNVFYCTNCTVSFLDKEKFNIPKIKVQLLENAYSIPAKAKEGDSGFDLYLSEDVTLEPGEMKLCKTGIQVELPENYEFQVRPRSSNPKKLLIIPNSPGTVDNLYRGEVRVWLYNTSNESMLLQKGERYCQLIPCRVDQMELEIVNELNKTERGDGGFGHTGQ